MKTFGAQYVVYEDSGFLAESVARIYPVMDRIVFLVGWNPWMGTGDPAFPRGTLRTIAGLPDPDGKFIVLAKAWKDEKDQRNEGQRILREAGCEWCMIVDDDEMFNRRDVVAAKEFISADKNGITAFMGSQLVYWKNRHTAVNGLTSYLPLFSSTSAGEVEFNIGRCCTVRSGLWHCLPPETILCHHFSYVRSDGKMKRKLETFTHADKKVADWFERVWLKWEPDMTDLHPNPDNPGAFKKAVPADLFPYKLEAAP